MPLAFRPLSAVLALALSLALVAPTMTRAEPVISTEQLFDKAHRAWSRADYVSTYGYLMAFVQRDPPQMTDGGFAGQIEGWLDAAYSNAAAAAVAGGGLPAGVEAKGDFAGPSNGGRPRVDFDPPARLAPRQPRSYRLECRGGGRMSANYYPGSGSHRLEIHFDKAPRAARQRPPGPGQCAWVDRPVAQDEPWWLTWRFDASEQTLQRLMFGARGGNTGLSLLPNTTKYVSGLIMEVQGRQLQRLIAAVHRGRPFAVDCYNDRRGKFRVTAVHVE